MIFKLLAIRPLNECDPTFLKNLRKNCIYRFYNEYDYEFLDNEKEKVSAIDLQNRFLESENQKELEYYEITTIQYIQKVPDSFYGKNVSVSAVVGKNGSGKSTLLELLYSFIFNIGKKSKILKFEYGEVNYNKIDLEIYYLYNNEYYKIVHKNTASEVKTTVFKAIDNDNFIKVKNVTEILFKFYSLVINYSIYSLNSKISGNWVKTLFHKNDGYQTPIVINPFRNEGNVDVNNEYNLAQARLILNHFVIENDTLVDGIELYKVNYFLNITKAQYIANDQSEGGKEKLIIDDIITFVDINKFAGPNKISDLIDIIFSKKNSAAIKSLKLFIRGRGEDRNFLLNDLYINHQEKISYLCLLYIFKKLKRISYNYDEYKKYHFLFGWDNEVFNIDIEKFKKNFRKKTGAAALDESLPIEIFYFQILESFKSYIQKHPILTLIDINFEENISEIINLSSKQHHSNINNVIDFVFDKLSEIVDNNRINVLSNYIADLSRDNTHITFKFKQAINYFINNIFGLINIKPALNENNQINKDLYNVEIGKKFLNKDIYNIPISFFEPEILMKKNGKEYPFNRLSSGEQQMIHSILNITYHLYNIKSIEEKGRKKVYKHINIIFDEVELYFHPEFQKNFISNLIQNLTISEFKDFSFNIIFSTHSPFILSDIPTENILRLSEGIPLSSNDGANSFGANIHDLLADEFFLGGNTVGKFASNKIDKIINQVYCQYKINEINKDIENSYFAAKTNAVLINLKEEMENELKNFSFYKNEDISKIISMIGEPLISKKLDEMFKEISK